MENLTASIVKMTTLITNALSINGGIVLAIIAACIIMLLARKKSPRNFSFKVRASLNDVNGYSRLLLTGQLGAVTEEQKKYLDEILAGSIIVKSEIDSIEVKNIHSPDAAMSFNLRTALMEINGYSELLRHSQPALSAKQKEGLDDIQKAANHILQLLTK